MGGPIRNTISQLIVILVVIVALTAARRSSISDTPSFIFFQVSDAHVDPGTIFFINFSLFSNILYEVNQLTNHRSEYEVGGDGWQRCVNMSSNSSEISGVWGQYLCGKLLVSSN